MHGDRFFFIFNFSHSAYDQSKEPSHESNQGPIVNNEWHNQQGRWAPIVRRLNGIKDPSWGRTIIQVCAGQLLMVMITEVLSQIVVN